VVEKKRHRIDVFAARNCFRCQGWGTVLDDAKNYVPCKRCQSFGPLLSDPLIGGADGNDSTADSRD
jgi:hypothetical protein